MPNFPSRFATLPPIGLVVKPFRLLTAVNKSIESAKVYVSEIRLLSKIFDLSFRSSKVEQKSCGKMTYV